MSVSEKKKQIVERLIKNIRVAVEYDGYAGSDPEAAFDAYEDNDLLENLEPFDGAVNRGLREGGDRAALLKPVRAHIDEIKTDLGNYADPVPLQIPISRN